MVRSTIAANLPEQASLSSKKAVRFRRMQHAVLIDFARDAK